MRALPSALFRLFHFLFPILPFPLLLILPPSSFSLIIRLRCFRLFVFVSSQPETHPCAANVIAVTRIVLAASSLFRSHGTGISTPSNVSMTNHSIVSSHIVTKIEGEFISIPFIPSTRNHFCEPSTRISWFFENSSYLFSVGHWTRWITSTMKLLRLH